MQSKVLTFTLFTSTYLWNAKIAIYEKLWNAESCFFYFCAVQMEILQDEVMQVHHKNYIPPPY